MVGLARPGAGAGGRVGAKGGTGTDCRTGPGDEAGQDTDGKIGRMGRGGEGWPSVCLRAFAPFHYFNVGEPNKEFEVARLSLEGCSGSRPDHAASRSPSA